MWGRGKRDSYSYDGTPGPSSSSSPRCSMSPARSLAQKSWLGRRPMGGLMSSSGINTLLGNIGIWGILVTVYCFLFVMEVAAGGRTVVGRSHYI